MTVHDGNLHICMLLVVLPSKRVFVTTNVTGHPPFESATPMQIYSKVQKGINKVSFPKKAKGDCEALVKALCHSTPAERLPMKKGGADNIRKHAWYKGFSFADMENFTADAPYKPVVKSRLYIVTLG